MVMLVLTCWVACMRRQGEALGSAGDPPKLFQRAGLHLPFTSHFTTLNERRIVLAQARLEGLRSLTRLDRPWNQEAAAHRAQAGSVGPGEEEGRLDDRRPVVDARI
jgi:hypothetical protein